MIENKTQEKYKELQTRGVEVPKVEVLALVIWAQ